MGVDSIIFDLDGTLWDSTEGVAKSWTEVLSKYEYSKKEVSVEELKGCMGKLLPDIGRILFSDLDEEIIGRLLEECCHRENKYLEEHGGLLYDKLEETLNKLSESYKLFIVSNCQAGYIECFLKAHDLSKYFIDFECPGKTGLPKAENIKLIIERNCLKNPIYVGDTQGDADSTKKVEIPFIFARYGFGNVEDHDYAIETFEDLLKLEL